MDSSDLESRFTYHAPEDSREVVTYQSIRAQVRQVAESINDWCPDSRELSLAITHLEEAVFWANAAIARHGLRRSDG